MILEKILRRISPSTHTFEFIAFRFLVPKGGDSDQNSKLDSKQVLSQSLQSSASLSLFLTLRHVHLECLTPAGQASKKFDDILSTDLLASTKYMPQLANLIKCQTYLYPRLHSSV